MAGEIGDGRGVRMMRRISSMREKPVPHHPRRLADQINPTGAEKVHSLGDKVYRMKRLVTLISLILSLASAQ